jgi:hypothetical protein
VRTIIDFGGGDGLLCRLLRDRRPANQPAWAAEIVIIGSFVKSLSVRLRQY